MKLTYSILDVSMCLILENLLDLSEFIAAYIQGVSSQTGKSNLVLREGRKDISDILWHFFSIKFRPILISQLVFIKKLGNYEKSHELIKNRENLEFFCSIFFFKFFTHKSHF